MARQWLALERDLKIRQLLKLATIRLSIESGRGILWLVRATVQGAPELAKEVVSVVELGSLLVVKVAPRVKGAIVKVQDRIDLSFTKIDAVLRDLSKTVGAIPYGGHFIDADAEDSDVTVTAATIDEPVANIREATKGRHLIILGDTGTGKTTTAQYVAVENSLAGSVQVKVYDCEGMFKTLPGWQLIGAGENFDAINAAMAEDLDNLSIFFQTGQPEAKEPTHIYIGEEFPDIVDQCDNAPSWTDRHSRRGRKAGRFLILLSQYDQIGAFGLEGKSGLLKNFRIVRLGEFALAHAKRLKNPALVKWLEQNKSHCLLNDSPLQLPSYEEMTRTINQFSFSLGASSLSAQSISLDGYTQPTRVIQNSHAIPNSFTPHLQSVFPNQTEISPEMTENQGFQPSEKFSVDAEMGLLERILAAFEDGKSDGWIAANILDSPSGNQWYRAKDRVSAIRAKLGRN